MIAHGASGTCSWEIDDDYQLTIWPTNGTEGFLEDAPFPVVGERFHVWPWHRSGLSQRVRCVVIKKGVKAGQSLYASFHDFDYMTSIDLSGLDTSCTRCFACMFVNCFSLHTVDVRDLVTAHAENMVSMFSRCYSLSFLDLSNWDTRNLKDMCGMFSFCENLHRINFENFDTHNVTWMNGVFDQCGSLSILDLSSFDTSRVTQTLRIFLVARI